MGETPQSGRGQHLEVRVRVRVRVKGRVRVRVYYVGRGVMIRLTCCFKVLLEGLEGTRTMRLILRARSKVRVRVRV